jgi:hypothetical protein
LDIVRKSQLQASVTANLLSYEELETAVALLTRFIGREPGNLAALAYARWLVEDMQGLREWMGVMETAVGL